MTALGGYHEMLDILATEGVCGIDTETTVARNTERELCTVQVAHSDGREALVHCYNDFDMITSIADAVEASPAILPAHNALFDLSMFTLYGAAPRNMVCTLIAARILRGQIDNAKVPQSFGLAAVALNELGMVLDKDVRKRDWRQPLDETAIGYAMQDARAARDLWLIFSGEFEQDPDNWRGFTLINNALPALAECNLTGLVFDREAHEKMCHRMEGESDEHLLALDILCGCSIDNHNSPAQVSRWIAEQISMEPGCTPRRAAMLFGQTGFGWPVTASGLSMDKKVIERLLEPLEVGWPQVAAYVRARVQFKQVATLLTSFGPTLDQKIESDGRLRTTLWPHGAKTSRQSSSDPNLQNQPNDPGFRSMYKVAKGRKLVAADYSQIELRVGCIIAEDEAMQEVFRSGKDIHAATFENIQRANGVEVEYDDTIPWHVKGRKGGKSVTFAALYGAQASTIALNSGISMVEAGKLLGNWLAAYPGIDNYRETQPGIAREAGYIQLVSGQKITVLEDARDAQLINAPVQGSAASVMYLALAYTYDALKARPDLDVRMALNVHDEILLDAAEEDALECARILTREMTRALKELYPEAEELGLAHVADAAICDHWGQKDDPEFQVMEDVA